MIVHGFPFWSTTKRYVLLSMTCFYGMVFIDTLQVIAGKMPLDIELAEAGQYNIPVTKQLVREDLSNGNHEAKCRTYEEV